MKMCFGKKLTALLLLLAMALLACTALAEDYEEDGPTGDAIIHEEDEELTSRGGTLTSYTRSGSLTTGSTVTFTLKPSKQKAVKNYTLDIWGSTGIGTKKSYLCIYSSKSSTFSFDFRQPGTYRLYVNYADGEWDYTKNFKVTGEDFVGEEADKIVDACNKYCEGKGDYEKALYFHDYLTTVAYYDSSLAYHGPDGVLLRGYGVCQSYASAFHLLMNKAGLECVEYVSKAQNHLWNVMRLNGKWYLADLTWDVLSKAALPEQGSAALACKHTYFALPASVFCYNHYGFTDQWNCTSVEDNYYRHQGCDRQIEEVLAEQIKEYLEGEGGTYSLNADDAVKSKNIGEVCDGETYLVRGDLAAELAVALINGTTYKNDDGDEFYVDASHKASSCDSKGKNRKIYFNMVANVYLVGGKCNVHVNWNYSNGTLTIDGFGSVPGYTVGHAPWNSQFAGKITSVVIGDEITSVGAAFRDCTNVTQVTIPQSVTEMSSIAFKNCKKLKLAKVVCGTAGLDWAKTVKIPYKATGTHKADDDGVCNVCGASFKTKGDGILQLPASLQEIGDKAFAGSSASALVIPKDCKDIPEDAFADCDDVTMVFVPEGLEDDIPDGIEDQLIDIIVVDY